MAINSTAIWRVRPSGINTNGGGYDPGIAGAATDYSQQNAAQASGVHGTATGTTTFIDATASAFTAAMIGNCIQIASGAGFTAGFYFVTGYTSASTVTLDRSPGTGTVAVWALGGGWADFWTNTTANIVPGNLVYILGSGIPNPAAYSYDYTANTKFTPVSGDSINGYVVFANDPATPGYKAAPDTTGGMPCITITVADDLMHLSLGNKFLGLYFVAAGTLGGGDVFKTAFEASPYNPFVVEGCVVDQNGFNVGAFTNGNFIIRGCEVFSSGGAVGSSSYAIDTSPYFTAIIGCNIHDTYGHAIRFGGVGLVEDTIIAKCGGNGIVLNSSQNYLLQQIKNCTIDGNLGNGIEVASSDILNKSDISNNIISNHTQAGKYGLTVDAGTAATNDLVKGFVDYNTYYNNMADLNAISYGPHDTHGGANPYVGQTTENYSLA